MTKKNGKRQTPMDELIRRSVEQALATWLAGQAVRATEQMARDELWGDEEFRREFLDVARRVARETLARLGDKP